MFSGEANISVKCCNPKVFTVLYPKTVLLSYRRILNINYKKSKNKKFSVVNIYFKKKGIVCKTIIKVETINKTCFRHSVL